MTNKKIAVESTVLLQGAAGVADSRILSDFRSMIEAEAVARARNAGYSVHGEYCRAGEFGIDITGEIGSAIGKLHDGSYFPEGIKGVIMGDFTALLSVDSNGYPRRAAATNELINVKPTYGTVSRYGIVPVASSSDTVSITARSADDCEDLLKIISGQDEKDPTTVSDELSPLKSGKTAAPIRRIGISREIVKNTSVDVRIAFADFLAALNSINVEIVEIPKEKTELFNIAHAAWNIILCAEAWGNLSRYDGLRYGKRAENCKALSDVYVKSRSEGFGTLIKSALLYGSYALSPQSDGGLYFKATEAKAWVKNELNRLMQDLDGILLPASSVVSYTEDNIKNGGITAFNENFYTALPSLCGLPTVSLNSMQLIGKSFSDFSLLNLARTVSNGG